MEREDGPRNGDREAGGPAGLALDPEGFERRVAQYVEWARTHYYSPATVEHRAFLLRRFVTWCAERGLLRPSEITKPILERYQAWLFDHRTAKGQPLSLTTQTTYLVPVQALFKWLARQNLILSNPASDLTLPRVPKRIPTQVMTVEEVERVLNQPDVATTLGLRDRAILEVLYSTGIRRVEIARLKLFDLDATGGTMMIREGKGHRQRVVPIGQRAIAWVEKYLAEARPRLVGMEPDEGWLFLSERAQPLGAGRLTNLGHKYKVAAGVAKRGSVHIFRHTCATTMLERGADVRFLQAMLGHARLDTTEVYTHVSIAKLKEVHAATHPADNPATTSPPSEAAEPPAPTKPPAQA